MVSQLPQEIILHIISALIPSPPPLVLPPQHVSTKTLLSLTLVSRSCHEVATRLLYTYCVYIDQSWKMHKLCFTLLSQEGIESTHLTGLPIWNDPNETLESHTTEPNTILSKIRIREEQDLKNHILPSRPKTLPRLHPHRYIRSMYLHLFVDEDLNYDEPPHKVTDKDLSTMHSLSNTISLIKHTLRHLIIHINTSSRSSGWGLPPRRAIKLSLRSSLLSLSSLETFCSLRDECYLSNAEELGLDWPKPVPVYPPVWQEWRHLKIVVLTETYWNNHWLFNKLVKFPDLHTVVLKHPTDAHEFNLQAYWTKACKENGYEGRKLNLYFLISGSDADREGMKKRCISSRPEKEWLDESLRIKVAIAVLPYEGFAHRPPGAFYEEKFLENCLDGISVEHWEDPNIFPQG
jgi:hypothetical protein